VNISKILSVTLIVVIAVINSKCPMPMGGAVKPAGVSAELVREFDGKKIGFCCAGCLPDWDKLSDDGKKAALAKVMPASSQPK